MALPVSFDNVPYSEKTFEGDLVITYDALYFFPHTNLEEALAKKYGWLERFGFFGTLTALLAERYSLHFGSTRTLNSSLLHRSGRLLAMESSDSVQKKLDSLIAAQKKESSWLKELSGEFTALKPIRFPKSEASKIRITTTGKLLFDSRYDSHDFLIGLKRIRQLKTSMREGGYV